MPAPSIGILEGHALPSDALRRRIGQLYPGAKGEVEVQRMLDDLVGVDALARLLTEGIDKTLTTDGRLDTKELAAFVLRAMRSTR